MFLQIITIICGLIAPRLILEAYGSEAHGATTAIAQFLSYITLLEGGIGAVGRAALYKPLAEKDTKHISVIVHELKRYFRIIAYISIGYTLILACFFQKLSHIESYDWLSTFMLVLAMAISTFGQYFIGISYSALIQADQRQYILNVLSIVTTVLNTIMTIVLVKSGTSLILVKLVSSCVFLIKPTAMWLYVEKHYGLIHTREHDKNALSQKWSGLGQHIAYYIHSNTDVAVLTILDNLKTVSVYSVHTMVTTHIRSIVTALCSGMGSLFGDMYAKNEHQQLNTTFDFYETLISVTCTILFSAVYVMIVPFVSLYTKGIEDVNYIQPLFAYLITAATEIYCIRIPYESMISAAGHIKQTRIGAYGEALINVSVSVILVWRFGLIGVAIGTIAAVGFRLVYNVFYLSHSILDRSALPFIKHIVLDIGITLAICIGCGQIIQHMGIFSYLTWAFGASITVIISIIVTIIANFLFYKEATRKLLSIIRNKLF